MNIKYISVLFFLSGATVFGQIKTNKVPTINSRSNAFLDASENTINYKGNIGRGLLFPQTDLSQFKLDKSSADGINYPTYFDGMIVYNTKEGGSTSDENIKPTANLEKGFYYFSNPNGKKNSSISEGQWVKLGSGNIDKGLLAGENAPEATLGSKGDTYLDINTGDIWSKSTGTWVKSNNKLNGTNLYTSDGELTSNRKVHLNGKKLVFDGGYVGIGTDNPQVDLSIVGKPDGNAEISLTRYADNGNGANLTLSKAYGTPDTPKVPPVGSNLARFRSSGYIGENNWDGFASSISTDVAGAPVNGALPTDMFFVVTNDQGKRNTLLKLQGNSGVGVGFPTTQDIKARLQVNHWNDVTLTSTNNAFMIGKETGPNLVMDNNEIMARDNGGVSGLHLQAEGGALTVWNGLEVSERVRFTGGKLGIGTITPTEKLEVAGSIKSTALAEPGGGNRPVYADENGKLVIGSASMSGNFYGSNGILTSNRNVNLAEYDLTFTSNNNSKKGKVGIGTNRPVSKLHVESDDDTQYAAFFTRNPNAGVNVVHGKEQGIGIFNNALGNYLISRSPVANAKPFIFDVRTEENLTSPTSGSLYYNFKIQNKEVASLSNEGLKLKSLAEENGGKRPVYADSDGKLVIGTASDNLYTTNGTISTNRKVSFGENASLELKSATDENPSSTLLTPGTLKLTKNSRNAKKEVKAFILDPNMDVGGLVGRYNFGLVPIPGQQNANLHLFIKPVSPDGRQLTDNTTVNVHTDEITAKQMVIGKEGIVNKLLTTSLDTNTAKITNLPPGSNTDKVVVADGEGNLKQRSLSELKRANLRIVTGSTTLNSNDEGGYVYVNSTSAVTVTVPSSLPAGFSCVIVQKGTGQVTVAGSGVTLETAKGKKTRAKHSAIGVIKDTVSSATITGDAVM